MKKFLIIGFAIIVVFAGVVVLQKFFAEKPVYCIQDAKLCKDGILITSPKTIEKIKNPVKIEGTARGFWFFEAQFTAELFDANTKFLGRAILTARDDWMTEDFVPFEGELTFSSPATSLGTLKFLSANPSGLPENQKVFEMPIQFEETPHKKVLFYYYNPEKDKDETGNIKCSRDGLVAIERKIPITQTPIQDAIKLLLLGELTDEERAQGISTEYPLAELSLKGALLKNGVLTLEFDDPNNKTVGGSCRVGILWFQIEATAKQFPEVREVRFLPEELFQP